MKKISIQGKDYVPVHERLMEFWAKYPEWSIRTEILESPDGAVRFQCCIIDGENRLRSTGHSEEKEGSTFINKTSYLENAETSAVGRALGLLGIGIDTALATYEEVANALANEDQRPWLSEEQLGKIISGVQNGERDLIEKAFATYRMKKDYRLQLEKL